MSTALGHVLSEMVLPTLRFQARNIHSVCTDPCPHEFDGPNVKESYGDLTTSRFWGRWPHNLGSRLNAKQNFEQLARAASLRGSGCAWNHRCRWTAKANVKQIRILTFLGLKRCSDVLGPKMASLKPSHFKIISWENTSPNARTRYTSAGPVY